MKHTPTHKCSFCLTDSDQLVAGPDVFICRNCVDRCRNVYEAVRDGGGQVGGINEHKLTCSFCGSVQDSKSALFTNFEKFICTNCVCLCLDINEHVEYVMERWFVTSGKIYEI